MLQGWTHRLQSSKYTYMLQLCVCAYLTTYTYWQAPRKFKGFYNSLIVSRFYNLERFQKLAFFSENDVVYRKSGSARSLWMRRPPRLPAHEGNLLKYRRRTQSRSNREICMTTAVKAVLVHKFCSFLRRLHVAHDHQRHISLELVLPFMTEASGSTHQVQPDWTLSWL